MGPRASRPHTGRRKPTHPPKSRDNDPAHLKNGSRSSRFAEHIVGDPFAPPDIPEKAQDGNDKKGDADSGNGRQQDSGKAGRSKDRDSSENKNSKGKDRPRFSWLVPNKSQSKKKTKKSPKLGGATVKDPQPIIKNLDEKPGEYELGDRRIRDKDASKRDKGHTEDQNHMQTYTPYDPMDDDSLNLAEFQRKKLDRLKAELKSTKRTYKILRKKAIGVKKKLEEIEELEQLDEEAAERLLETEKLVLVLDLDHTLLNAKKYRKSNHDAYPHARFVTVSGGDGTFAKYHVSIRPGVKTFLKAVQEFFELHVFTFGGANYAKKMVEILKSETDCEFGLVLSSTEWFNKHTKSIAPLFPYSRKKVIVLDDNKDNVWKDPRNLIRVYPYFYFTSPEVRTKKQEAVRLFQSQSSRVVVQHVFQNFDDDLYAVYRHEDKYRENDPEGRRHQHWANITRILQQVYCVHYPDNAQAAKARLRVTKRIVDNNEDESETDDESDLSGSYATMTTSSSGSDDTSSVTAEDDGGGRSRSRGRNASRRGNSRQPEAESTDDTSSSSSGSDSSLDDEDEEEDTSASVSTDTYSEENMNLSEDDQDITDDDSESDESSSREETTTSDSETSQTSYSGESSSDGEPDVRDSLALIRPNDILRNKCLLSIGGHDRFNKDFVNLANALGAGAGYLHSQYQWRDPDYMIIPQQSWKILRACHEGDQRYFITIIKASYSMCDSTWGKWQRTHKNWRQYAIPVVSVCWLVDSFLSWRSLPIDEYRLEVDETVYWIPGMLIIEKDKPSKSKRAVEMTSTQ